MKKINILLTSAGNDGCPSVINSLRKNGEREIEITAVDCNRDSAGLHLADCYFVVPKRDDEVAFINAILLICQIRSIEIIFPLSTLDQEFFAKNAEFFQQKGIKVIVSEYSKVHLANNKLNLCKFARENGINVPLFTDVKSYHDFKNKLYDFFDKDFPVVIKSNTGTGAQGLKIAYNSLPENQRFYDRDNRDITKKEAELILRNFNKWDEIHLCEYLPGSEFSVDILLENGKPKVSVARKRIKSVYGLATVAEIDQRKDVIDQAEKLVSHIGLTYIVNVQFRCNSENKPFLLEINPRVPGTISLTHESGVNMPYLAIKIALGETIPSLFSIEQKKIMRYWTGVFVEKE